MAIGPRIDPLDPICRNCRYFALPLDYTLNDGICRRYPPRVKFQGAMGRRKASEISIWPSVGKDDGCGEFVHVDDRDTAIKRARMMSYNPGTMEEQ